MYATESIEVAESKFGAAIYEPFLWLGEKLGMARRRARLLAGARGRVLEIGAGTGLNLRHYPAAIEELVLVEPAETMAAKIDTSGFPGDSPVSVVLSPAERLPFADDSFDTVVSTMVLCTVSDPEQALAEISRVLRPGGKLLFCEHVASDGRVLGGLQRRLAGPWAAFAEGCRCDRRTVETIDREMRLGPIERDNWRGMAPLVRPLVIGTAEPR
ncbi:MAG TPA: class I SAM-dependent methyltransferase [Solirubrobacterales bacterium]|nr:class I SAM-dependent methyltransferase [Solirubrobacterales bacterium]